MAKKLLIAVLIISLIIELTLTTAAFFAREYTLAKFGLSLTSDTSFLAYVLAWSLLFVSLVCLWAVVLVIKNGSYALPCYILGFWWVGIGIGIYVAFKKPDNLFLDSLKGLFIIILTASTAHRPHVAK